VQSTGLSGRGSKGRVDIRYRTNAGEHIIVELKRAQRKLHLYEVVDQGGKYKTALHKCLVSTGIENPHISVVFVVGQSLHEEDDATAARDVVQTLRSLNTKVVHYEALIRGARDAYDEYLQRSAKADRLDKVLRKL